MIYIPQNDLENMVDLIFIQDLPVVTKIIVNGNFGTQISAPVQVLNDFANFMQLCTHKKEILFFDQNLLDVLRQSFSDNLDPKFLQVITSQYNTLEIFYVTNGGNHVMKIKLDHNWKIIDDPNLSSSKYILGLNQLSQNFQENNFIEALQKLPLFNYLSSIENNSISSTLVNLTKITYQVEKILSFHY